MVIRNTGRYLYRDSIVHNSNCASKISFVICASVSVFLSSNYLYYIMTTLLVCLLAVLSKVPPRYFLKDIKSAWLLISLGFLVQLFDGVSVVTLQRGIVGALRIFIIVFSVSLFMRTTKPTEVSHFIEKFLRLLGISRQRSRDISLTFSLSMRFFPILIDEIDRTRISQRLRGVDLSRGKITTRLSSSLTIIVPVILSSFRRAEQLATAIEARRYGLSEVTSEYYQNRLKLSDILILGFTTISILALISLP
ncbi:MAG: energy-coupling factor transporter transmembrane component T [Pseudothermotoga sp.]